MMAVRNGSIDVEFARDLASQVGDLLLRVRSEGEPRTAGSRGDAAAQALIASTLATRCPEDQILSEEAADDLARLHAARVWIVDPLDGTREFAEPGRHDWAVHVALWQAGYLVAGAVALPAVGHVLDSAGVQPPPAGPDTARIRTAVSRTRPPAVLDHLAETLPIDPVPMGSAGYKACAVIRGEVDAYVHAGGQYEWDSAAPVVVARAAGLHTSRLDGSPLVYNQRDVCLPDLLICRPELAAPLLEALRTMEMS